LIKILQTIINQKILLPFFHTVADEPLPHIKHLYKMKTVKEFTEDLDFLLKYFEPIDAETLFYFHSNQMVPKKPVFHLSFDDGLKEMYEIVAPILLQKGVPATFFINSGFIDNKALFYRFRTSLSIENLNSEDFLKDVQPYLSTEQIQSLSNQGFTIGAHSVDHPYYHEIPFAEQMRQTRESLEFVASIVNQKLRLFAFPFTDFNVSKKFFEKIKPFVDLSFGTAGMKNDEITFNYQRIAGEKDRLVTLESVFTKEYLKYLAKFCLRKNTIYRK